MGGPLARPRPWPLGLATLAGGHIGQAFHRQATADLFVAEAELDHGGQLGEGSGRIGARGNGGSTAGAGSGFGIQQAGLEPLDPTAAGTEGQAQDQLATDLGPFDWI